MNNKEFVNKLAQRCKQSTTEVNGNVEAFINIITDRLKDSDQINISGFGVFDAKLRRERLSVNPKTGQRMLIPPKIVPAFRPGSKLKDKFKTSEE
ncbi:MAG: HU family DNA-binding protein [Bacteroidaceae bacterium]|nr:HU family DNA-binding protein [Bacteroidaceae bacterium]